MFPTEIAYCVLLCGYISNVLIFYYNSQLLLTLWPHFVEPHIHSPLRDAPGESSVCMKKGRVWIPWPLKWTLYKFGLIRALRHGRQPAGLWYHRHCFCIRTAILKPWWCFPAHVANQHNGDTLSIAASLNFFIDDEAKEEEKLDGVYPLLSHSHWSGAGSLRGCSGRSFYS